MSDRVRLLPVSADTLRRMLKLPDTTKIVGAYCGEGEFAQQGALLTLKIEDDRFSRVPHGHCIERVDVELRRADVVVDGQVVLTTDLFSAYR